MLVEYLFWRVMSFDNLGVSNFDVKDQNDLANRWKKWIRGFEYLVVGRDITKEEQKKSMARCPRYI